MHAICPNPAFIGENKLRYLGGCEGGGRGEGGGRAGEGREGGVVEDFYHLSCQSIPTG